MITKIKIFEDRYHSLLVGNTIEIFWDVWAVLKPDELEYMDINSDRYGYKFLSKKFIDVGDKISFTSIFGDKIEEVPISYCKIASPQMKKWDVTINRGKGLEEHTVSNDFPVTIYSDELFLKEIIKRIEIYKKTTRFDL